MQHSPTVYWITGLSGSGKSTLCTHLVHYLKAEGSDIIKLDGDELREVMGALKNHDRDSRIDLAKRYSKLCRLLSSQGFNVAIATISMFSKIHHWNRLNIPGYKEIYLDVPIRVLKQRDPKGIYQKASSGKLHNVAGIDLQVDPPENPDVILKYEPHKKSDEVFQELKLKLNL